MAGDRCLKDIIEVLESWRCPFCAKPFLEIGLFPEGVFRCLSSSQDDSTCR